MASNITTQYFKNLFEEFTKVPEAKLLAYFDIATTRVPETVWGNNTKYATALLTAHMLTASGVQGSGASGGVLTQASVGDLSRSFSAVLEPGSGDALLRTTRYGLDFLALRSETFASAMTTRGPLPFRRC